MPRGKTPIIDENYLKKVKELHQSGYNINSIAKTVHSAIPTISKCLKGMGFKLVRGNVELKLDLNLIKHLYLDERLPCSQIAEKLGCSENAIIKRVHAMCCMRSLSEADKIASESRSTSKVGRINMSGYTGIRMPEHHLASKGGYVLEHRLVWEQYHKKPLPKGYHIHHLNGIKTDNRPSNLVALPPTKHHEKHLSLLAERAKRIRELEIENRQLRQALENSQMIFSVSEN